MTRVSYPRMLTAGSREQAVQVDTRQVSVGGAEQPASLADSDLAFLGILPA